MSLPAGLPRGARVVQLAALGEIPRPPGAAGWIQEALAAGAWPAMLLRAGAWTVPRAQGESVMVLPGFGASDASTAPLRSTLRRCGYRVAGWQLGWNRGNVMSLLPRVRQRVADLADVSGAPVRLVGWSLGGVLAREVAREVPEIVDRVVTLGTPVIGGPKFTNVASVYRALGVDVDAIAEQVAQRNLRPIRVPVVAIYSRRDGVVDWRASIDRTTHDVEHIEVKSSHLQLGLSPEVHSIVADRLHASRGKASRGKAS